jgi:hypothetical protein
VSVPVGHAVPTLTSSIASFVNGDKPTVVTGEAREVTPARQGSPAGVYAIDVAKGTLEASNYTFNFVDVDHHLIDTLMTFRMSRRRFTQRTTIAN